MAGVVTLHPNVEAAIERLMRLDEKLTAFREARGGRREVRSIIEQLVEELIEFLDLDDEPDDEPAGDEQDQSWPEGCRAFTVPYEDAEDDDPAEDNGDREPSLGSLERHPGILGFINCDQSRWGHSSRTDREDEHDGAEPDGYF